MTLIHRPNFFPSQMPLYAQSGNACHMISILRLAPGICQPQGQAFLRHLNPCRQSEEAQSFCGKSTSCSTTPLGIHPRTSEATLYVAWMLFAMPPPMPLRHMAARHSSTPLAEAPGEACALCETGGRREEEERANGMDGKDGGSGGADVTSTSTKPTGPTQPLFAPFAGAERCRADILGMRPHGSVHALAFLPPTFLFSPLPDFLPLK